MRFLHRALSGLVLTAITLALLGWSAVTLSGALRDAAREDDRSRARAERPVSVQALTVVAGAEAPMLTVPGELRARRALQLRARASGMVVFVAEEVEEGGEVRAGQLLIQTNPAAAQAALLGAETDLSEAQQEVRAAARSAELAQQDLAAAMRQAQLQTQAFRRQQDLSARGVGSASATETAELASASADQAVVARMQAAAESETRIAQAAARLARAEVALGEARRALSDTEIFAAFDGTLANVSVVNGGLVALNEQLADLVDPNDLEVGFRLSTAQYSRLIDADGRLAPMPLRLTLEAGGLTLETTARLDRAAALVGEGETGRLVFARLDRSAGFRAGDLVRVLVQEPAIDGVARLPARAITHDGLVMRIDAGNRVVAEEVTVLRRQGDEVLIRAGALAGAQIVAAVTPLIGPGLLVEPSEPAPVTLAEAPPTEAMLRLTPERRAALIAFVETNAAMPEEMRSRVLGQLAAEEVPAQVVARLERRMGI